MSVKYVFKIKGIGLVEVIVAAALVAVGMVSLSAIAVQSSVFSRNVDIAYISSYIAQRRVDMLKRFDFVQLSAFAETDIRVGNDGNSDPYGDYLRTTEIIPNFDNNRYLAKIKVTVKRIRLGSEGRETFLITPVVMETLFVEN